MSKFGKTALNLGAGLLSETSQQIATNGFQIAHIPLSDIVPNEKNVEFSMNEIEELKTSIREVGLEQNLVVVKSGDKFRLLTGHRRYKALSELYAEGDEKYKVAPCIVKDLSKIDLPLDEEIKEMYAIATTNAEVRKNSDGDRIALMKMLSTVYDELKKNGYGKLGKRREFIATRLGVSPSTVKMLGFIDNNLTDEFKEDFVEDKLPITVAHEVAHLNEPEQKALKQSEPDSKELSVADVKAFRKQVESKEPDESADIPEEVDVGREANTFDFVQIQRSLSDVQAAYSAAGTLISAEKCAMIQKIEQDILRKIKEIESML